MTDMAENDGNEMETIEVKKEDAGQVFLLMGKEYRISRSIRAQWFFQQFNSILGHAKPKEDMLASNEELELLSVLSRENHDDSNHKIYKLVPSTHITFIGRRYKFVFCLDISPSLATVDTKSETVITDEVYEKFRICLSALVMPFSVPGNSIVLCPELHITVLAYTSILSPEAPQIILQGCLVTEDNLETVLHTVEDQLHMLEDILAGTVTSSLQLDSKHPSEGDGLSSDTVTLLSPEAGPIAMLRAALLALQLLPDNASAGAVVITDGVFALPDASAVDSMLAQLRASTVCCSFLKVGSGFHANCSLGYVPHCDLMQFIAMATSGAYLSKCPPVKKPKGDGKQAEPVMNLYHKSLLCWSFQKDYELSKIDSWIGSSVELNQEDLAFPVFGNRSKLTYSLSEWEKNAMQPSMHKKQIETTLHTCITSVLSVRLREGYSLQDVSFTKGGKQIEVRLTLPWKQQVQMEYVAIAAWPISSTNRVTRVEVTVSAPYEFLLDVTYHNKEQFNSGYRALVVKKFRQTMKGLQSNDELLVHLQSFSSNPSYFTIPDSAKNGVPLFYLPPNSHNPVLSLQHAKKTSKSQESQFAVFWKPVLTLDTAVWQKWMHCHRIGLILQHDVPLPKNLHLPVGNERFHSIQCRMALSSLNSLFRDFSSFVLLENHSYIKFIWSSQEEPPPTFCLIRVTSRAPCIVVRLAFLGGTPGHHRHSMVKDILSKLRQVTAPLGLPPSSKVAKSKKRGQRLAEEKICVKVLKKPLERILVRYERVPEDLFAPYPEVPLFSVYSSFTGVQYANRTNENHMKVLCQYLYHHRWIWSVQTEGPTSTIAQLVARVLGTLTKLRLEENFNFACSNAGIITMAKEIELKDPTCGGTTYPCLIQYVMFPPYTRPAGSAVEEWVDEGKPHSPESERKLQMVTEVWIEPQFGVIHEPSSDTLDGLRYFEVPQAIFENDYYYVSALLTFDCVWRMCDDQLITSPPELPAAIVPRPPPSPARNWSVESVPLPLDVIQLLPKARQTEMVFSSLSECATQVPERCSPGELPNETLFRLLIEEMQQLNDREIQLSEQGCRGLVKHVIGRDRNGIPVPFLPLYDSKEVPVTKWRCFARSLSGLGSSRLILTFIPASLAHVQEFGKRYRPSVSSTSSDKSLNSTLESTPSKHSVVLEGVQEALAKRALTPILEDAEGRSSSPTPVSDTIEDPFNFQKNARSTSTPVPENTKLTTRQEKMARQPMVCVKPSLGGEGKGLSLELGEKTVSFKDEDNAPTPTQENVSPRGEPCCVSGSDGSFCYNIPIYCYDCLLNGLLVVDEKTDSSQGTEETRKKEDIFQDFTQTSAVFVDPFSLEELPRMVEGRTFGRFGSSKDLLLHCNAVHDIFFRCFVSSIFTSLQGGHQVNPRDVQSAVDTCEENFVELDITDFIRTLCSHYSKNSALRKSQGLSESAFLLCQQSQLEIFPRRKVEEYDCVKQLMASLQGECESIPGLHRSIRDTFGRILGTYFKPVPNSSDLYFYSPHCADSTRKSTSGSFEVESAVEGDSEPPPEAESQDQDGDQNFDGFVEDLILIQDEVEEYDDSDDSDFDGSDDESEEAEDDQQSLTKPLFLQLTCSLRDKSSRGGGSITPVSVKTLPVCIGELVRKIEVAEEYLDPFSPSLHITLDLNCLTLSPDPDYSSIKSAAPRGYPFRSNSFSSAGSPLSLSPQERSFEFKRQDSKTTSHDIDGINGRDPLRILPSQQRLAMNVTCDSITWLLQDEIVSELRHRRPVTQDTLIKVERHVQKSEGHTFCNYRDVPLQFVFGAEQSMELFRKEFEEISVLEYRLDKVEDYYYLHYDGEDRDEGVEGEDKRQKVVEHRPMASNVSLNKDEESDELLALMEGTLSRQSSVKEEEEEGEQPVDNIPEGVGAYGAASSINTNLHTPIQGTTGEEKEQAERDADSTGGTSFLAEVDSFVSCEHCESTDLIEKDTADANSLLSIVTSAAMPATFPSGLEGFSTPVAGYSTPLCDPPSEQQLTPVQAPADEAENFKHKDEPSSPGITIETSPKGEEPSHEDVFSTSDNETSSDSIPRSPRRGMLEFWLVMRIYDNQVDIYFHRRNSEDWHFFTPTMAKGLIETVTNEIHEKSRIVNQRMLLQDLYETKMCNSLLFPEADEDIWKHEDLRMSVSPVGVYISKGNGSGGCLNRYVSGEYIFKPGHFQCNSLWSSHLTFHQRLRDPSGRTGSSRGRKVIMSVLERLAVSNRRNMFVYRENSGRVFYLRLLESLCVSDSLEFSGELRMPDQDEDCSALSRDDAASVISQLGSCSSSQLSLQKVGTDPEDESLPEPRSRRYPLSHVTRDTVEQSLALHVYGVEEPGTEITVDLLEVLHNRLDDATLEVISFMLARNPGSKLTYADVRFIQPLGTSPTVTLRFVIPPVDEGYLYPLSYYLKQNLLQMLHLPRYADANPSHHFKDPSATEHGTDIFVYNRPHSSGGRGLACIAMSMLDAHGQRLRLTTSRVPSINVENLDRNFYEGMTGVYALSDKLPADGVVIVQFSIWERGDIGLEQLSGQLKNITEHALCDLLIEYLLLPAPLSVIPEKYQLSSIYRLRSLSEPPTPTGVSPTSGKISDHGSISSGPSTGDSLTRGSFFSLKMSTEKDKTATSSKTSEGKGKLLGHRRSKSTDITRVANREHKRSASSTSQELKLKTTEEHVSTVIGKGLGHRRSKSTDYQLEVNREHKRSLLLRSQDMKPKSDPPTPAGAFLSLTLASITKRSGSSMPNLTQSSLIEIKYTGSEMGTSSVACSLEVAKEEKEESLTISGTSSAKTHDQENLEFPQPVSADLQSIENYYSICEDTKAGLKIEGATDIDVGLNEYETITKQEILESQEFAPAPATPRSATTNPEDSSPGNRKAANRETPPPGTSTPKNIEAASSLQHEKVVETLEIRRMAVEEKRKKRMKYENGETGLLHPNFHEPGRELFAFAHSLGVPSVHLIECRLLNRYAINVVLGEVSSLIANMCSEMKPRVYRQIPSSDHQDQGHTTCRTCPHYSTGRRPLKAQKDSSTADRSGQSFVSTPGSPCYYVLVARDNSHWRASLGLEDGGTDSDASSQLLHQRATSSQQRFQPLESGTGPMLSSGGDGGGEGGGKHGARSRQDCASITSVTSCTVPRQKLILLTVIDKEIVLYTYNLAADFTQSLETQIQRLVQWNNARCHLTSCLLTQKMGLFHHSLFSDIQDKKGKNSNPYVVSADDTDVIMLISRTAPSSHDRDRLASRSLCPANLLVFDRVLRDVTPPKTLQQTLYSSHRDPVKRHGGQFQEIRSAQIKTATLESTLDELYVTWQQRPPHQPIGVDKLELLQRSCRLIHYCACPLLFHPDWRRKLCTTNQKRSGIDGSTPQGSQSGASDTPQGSQGSTNTPQGSQSGLAYVAQGTHEEEPWHKELRSAYIQQYIQYMQSLQFVVVQTRPQSPKASKASRRTLPRRGGSRPRAAQSSSDAKKQSVSRAGSDGKRVFHQYLQKTSQGGIMLLELLFQGCHFYVHLYSLECSRIRSGKPVGPQMSQLFLEDCTHYKNYIHLLSFNYDFHLRQAQSYLSGRQLIFHPGYHVTDLLAEVLRQHSDYPGYARNHICRGEVAVPCEPLISSLSVYKYIVANSPRYDFSTIKTSMGPGRQGCDYILLGSDRVLIPPRHTSSPYSSALRDEYDITLVVYLKNAFEGSVINMEYYILMTSRRELFPKLSLEPRTHRMSLPGFGERSDIRERHEPKSTPTSPSKVPRVHFALSTSHSSSNLAEQDTNEKSHVIAETQPFHRSASTPHSLYQLAANPSRLPGGALYHSEEDIAVKKKSMSLSPRSQSASLLSTLDGRTNHELALLTDASNRAHDHLLHVVCRAQSHSKRDVLWYRLLSAGTGEGGDGKKRRKSEFRRPGADLAASWNSGIYVEEMYNTQASTVMTNRLTFEDFRHLLSVVECRSLRDTDHELIPLLSMSVTWYLSLFKVLMTKFLDFHRLITSDDMQYLALINPRDLDMLVLISVDEQTQKTVSLLQTQKTDVQVVFREDSKPNESSSLYSKDSVKSHIYSVLNAMCFHMWSGLLPS
ncbi:KICSTOR complex protein SZT2 isoform X3 [Nematostella vectensis]|uniref:KICSTOR complex protein SZT2 isoform X3 n=1 Tax=Nematostella vectensis TaxID=45351 RepID=UPI002076ECEA|nr:KICSTOR complex protein SZT2 isoform X3 [Nematostella vectensis]